MAQDASIMCVFTDTWIYIYHYVLVEYPWSGMQHFNVYPCSGMQLVVVELEHALLIWKACKKTKKYIDICVKLEIIKF